jgi:DNA invertase Pin-like site-specific DNA recombinase
MARTSRKSLFQGQPIVPEAPKATVYSTYGYGRISVYGERAEDSIESQAAIIQDYVDDSSRPDLVLKGVITDLGFSGTNFDRPGYTELMARIVSGEVQCVVVKDLSRLGRTYIEVGELIFDTFPEYNVRFISVNDQYDSFADDAARKKLLILFKNLVNHMYSMDLGKKIASSFLTKQRNGELLGSLPPYGYLYTTEGGGKRLKPEPESAEIVKLIFDMREQGISMEKIAEHLNRNNVAAPRNHYFNLGILKSEINSKKTMWQNNYIGTLLRNEVYIGSQIQGKYDNRGQKPAVIKPRSVWFIYENAHDAIVSKTQFDNVQSLLAKSGEKYKKLGNKLEENILLGKIFCARCGKSLRRLNWLNKKTKQAKFRYVCRDCATEFRITTDIGKVPHLAYEKLEEVIISSLQRQFEICIDIDTLIEDVTKSSAITEKCRSLKADTVKCRLDSKKADDMLAAAYKHHLAGVLDGKEFELARNEFEKDKKAAEAKAERAEAALVGYDLDKQRQNAFLTNFRSYKDFIKLDKEIVNALIHRIEVVPITNEISIVLNFADELKQLNSLIEESGVLADVF